MACAKFSRRLQVIDGTENIEEDWGIDVVSYECQVCLCPLHPRLSLRPPPFVPLAHVKFLR
jgi:hypothetical protein